MRDEIDSYQAGVKRKRIASGNENTSAGRGLRSGLGKVKRRRAMPQSSDDEIASGMEVDDHQHWELSDNSDDEPALDSSDSYLINDAPPKQLLRLRKDELVRLYVAAGLSEDAELLTKPEIVDCLIAARDDTVSLPPSSPGVADSNSSECSSDGGNIAGGEETDFGVRSKSLRRRATVADMSRTSRARPADRCVSMGQLDHRSGSSLKGAKTARDVFTPHVCGPVTRRRGASNASSSRSSQSPSTAVSSLPSPPVTRLRHRKLSQEKPVSIASVDVKGKGKNRQVEFDDQVQYKASTPFDDDSDLTDLTEVERSIASISPSPRRLRSKGEKERPDGRKAIQKAEVDRELGRRVVPTRKAKPPVGALREDDSQEDEEDELDDSETDQDEEVDQLIDSPSPSQMVTPKPSRLRTPVKKRLRPRQIQTHTPPSDGDDEESENEVVDGSVDGYDGENEGDDGRRAVSEESEGVDSPPLITPRKLRSGKVVTEDDGESLGDEDEDDEDEDEEDQSTVTEEDVDVEDVEEDVEEADEPMDDDIDLTVATKKTLIRLRRDDLVRLCETRELDATGTKPQLAKALLQWRDRRCSSPSSTGTVRPVTPKGRPCRKSRSKSTSQTPPVLLRSERIHLDEPRTPPLSGRRKEPEPELELDLESLGLEDREIPPEKLTKLEKIGSGGFKDVYIGKFKGRKVAIAEFRGQLSAMDIKELKLLGDFNHPNIVRFLGVSIPENTRDTPVMIVSELCSNGDLFDYIRNVNPPSLYRVLSIMLDIARGLEYLHTRKPSVIHRDCKSSNILITSKGVAKITDFGLAKVKQSTRSMMRSVVGTVNWQAPELWHAHPKYNHKVDVFSCAMVYWEMLQWHVQNKKYPWEGENEHGIYKTVGAERQRPSVSGLRKHWCPEIVDLMERMWAHEHQDRPSMTEVVEELEHLVQQYR